MSAQKTTTTNTKWNNFVPSQQPKHSLRMSLSTTVPFHKTTDDSHHCNLICKTCSTDKDEGHSSPSFFMVDDTTATASTTTTAPTFASRSAPLRRNNTTAATRPAVVVPPTRLLESLQETCDTWNDFPLLLGDIIGVSIFCPMLYILEIVLCLIRVLIVAGLWGRQLSSHPGTQMLKKGYSRVVFANSYSTISRRQGEGGLEPPR